MSTDPVHSVGVAFCIAAALIGVGIAGLDDAPTGGIPPSVSTPAAPSAGAGVTARAPTPTRRGASPRQAVAAATMARPTATTVPPTDTSTPVETSSSQPLTSDTAPPNTETTAQTATCERPGRGATLAEISAPPPCLSL